MKKRLLSLLMAMCLMATMVPAAFAADEENGRPIPDELPIVYDVEEDELSTVAEPPYAGSGTQSDPYIVDIVTINDFRAFRAWCEEYRANRYFKVTLKDNLDLSSLPKPAQWKGYLNFFMGTFDGNGKTISGIPEDCYLFYQIHNATIGNFTLDLNGEAGTLMYYTFRIGKADGSIEWGTDKLHDINVVSTDKDEKSATVQLVGNGQANYAPFMFAAGPYFTMDSCNNYANIEGDTYAAVFSGYYPLPASGYPSDSYFEFIDCENHGDVTLRYAGLFFGNPTGLREDRHISFDGVKNYGEIRGYESAHFFCSDAGAKDYFTGSGYFSETENMLKSLKVQVEVDGNIKNEDALGLTCKGAEEGCLRTDAHIGNLFEKHAIDDLQVKLTDDKSAYQVVVPSGTPSDYKYVVNAYAYVALFLYSKDNETGTETWTPDGTTRINMSEEVTAANDYVTIDLENIPLRGGEVPSSWEELDPEQCLYFCYDEDSTDYGYWLNSGIAYSDTHRVSINRNREPGSVEWNVYVSVYDGDTLVDTAVLNRQEVTR